MEGEFLPPSPFPAPHTPPKYQKQRSRVSASCLPHRKADPCGTLGHSSETRITLFLWNPVNGSKSGTCPSVLS